MHFVSALDTVWGVRAVLGLHETVCSGAADGYGRMALRPALTLLHLGPGLANALSNFHNCRRAGTPVVNVIGDMASWHKQADPLLNMDIESLAATVSSSVIQCTLADDPRERMAAAIRAAETPAVAGTSRVSTIIVPHDLSWTRSELKKVPQGSNGSARRSSSRSPPRSLSSQAQTPLQTVVLPETVLSFVKDCASSLIDQSSRGKVAIYIGGRAALSENGALYAVGRIAAALQAPIFCENAFSRLDRGAGLPRVRRLPYFPHEAAAALAPFSALLLVDVRRPVANFGYEGGPSQLIHQSDDSVWELDAAEIDIPAALEALCKAVGGNQITPGVNCRGVFAPPSRPPLPSGRLTASHLCTIVAALQPEGAILVDESLTSGGSYFDASAGCPQFSHLTLTGGAIGCGIPLSVGASMACPGRTVINLQADGSGLYSVQGLWTQAREGLKVITIVCANRNYAILKLEMAKQRISPSNGPAARALTDLGSPPVDWVKLGEGFGVSSLRADTCEVLIEAFKSALERSGPSLIEACL
jgi:acetolactate synthase-1/2/3 large subunit